MQSKQQLTNSLIQCSRENERRASDVIEVSTVKAYWRQYNWSTTDHEPSISNIAVV